MINGKLKYKVNNGVYDIYFSSYTNAGNDALSTIGVLHDGAIQHVQNIATQPNAVFGTCILADGDAFILQGIGDEGQNEDYIKGAYTAANGALTATFEHNIETTITLLS